jgi:hypothetical protein
MAETYRKFGRTLRYENGVFVRAEESGEAIEDGQTFTCRPIAHTIELPLIDDMRLRTLVREIESLIALPLAIERLVISEGIAVHEFGDRRWRETTERLHLSISFRALRAIIDLGTFALADVRLIAEALPRAAEERETLRRLALAPNVTASLLPSLVGVVPPNIQLWQLAGGVDGKGLPVETAELRTPPWPNWYRPSYRSRPVRAPFHLRATCAVVAVEPQLPRAIALLAPPEALLLNVLCVEGERVFPARIRVARIDAIGAEARWYPYGAGSFGALASIVL